MIRFHYFNPATDEQVKRARERAGVTSVLLTIPAILVLGVILYLIKILIFPSDIPVIVAYQATSTNEPEMVAPKVKVGLRLPVAPSMARLNFPVAHELDRSLIPLEIPVPEFDSELIYQNVGPVPGLGKNEMMMEWKVPHPLADLEPDAGSFGNVDSLFGGLTGRLYDFKQDRDLVHNDEYLSSNPDSRRSLYADYVNRIHREGFSESAFEPYFKAPQELSLTHLAISLRPAKEGPRYFGAENEMQPKVWMAHYNGTVTVPESGYYRFAGVADDYLSLFIDGRPELIACWPNLQPLVERRWHKGKDSDRWKTPINDLNLMFGRWIKLKKDQSLRLDLGIGERPGGELGFILLVEKKGESYKEAADGRPVLPLFTTNPFTKTQELRIKTSFPGFSFEWENVPVFRTE